jgi:metal-dependent amidase/aminoacylase/carboxypeptidase family protein
MSKAADMHGCALEVTWREPPYLPTINSLEMTGIVEEAAVGLVGPDRFLRLPAPTMAAEDFGYMAREFLSLPTLCIILISVVMQKFGLGTVNLISLQVRARC